MSTFAATMPMLAGLAAIVPAEPAPRQMTAGEMLAASACATGGSFCLPPPTVNLFQALPVIVKGIKRLLEGDD